MSFTIFYSWQSDTESRTNHYFIRDALRDAISDLASDAAIDEAPRLDHDTAGEPGNPDVADVIEAKIAAAGIFVADLTFIAKSVAGRPVPNPNVMLEYGYALKSCGARRIITVMNTAHGGPTELPFDISKRRHPLQYSAAAGEKPHQEVRAALTRMLKQAIAAVINSGPVRNVDLSLRAQMLAIARDPHHQVPKIASSLPEFILSDVPISRGLFNLLNGRAEPSAACVNNEEKTAIKDLLTEYQAFRTNARALGIYAAQIAETILPSVAIPEAFHQVGGYATARYIQWPHDVATALRNGLKIFVERELEELVAQRCRDDARFVKLITSTKEHADKAKAAAAIMAESLRTHAPS